MVIRPLASRPFSLTAVIAVTAIALAVTAAIVVAIALTILLAMIVIRWIPQALIVWRIFVLTILL